MALGNVHQDVGYCGSLAAGHGHTNQPHGSTESCSAVGGHARVSEDRRENADVARGRRDRRILDKNGRVLDAQTLAAAGLVVPAMEPFLDATRTLRELQ